MNGRIPELAPLAKSSIAVIGLGAVGAPGALELARAGVRELRLLDFDHVDPGTIVRWPLGLEAAGLLKTTSLPEFLAANYPYTKLKAYTHRLGAVRDIADALTPDPLVLDEVLNGANLVYDATAEIGIQHSLSDLARERGIPYVCASATEGAWGGLIARIRPGRTEGCWYCLMHHLDTGSIPTPPRSPTGTVQPIGCANPTFVGAGFDLTEVAIAAARLAVATLCADNQDGYPDYDWDVACLSLRDPEGKAIAPRWQTFTLKRHLRCELCREVAA
jgi:molybdopterin/thiamine biosynthesis adenylyltransferase